MSNLKENQRLNRLMGVPYDYTPPAQLSTNAQGCTISVWGRNFVVTYDWEKQESIIYVDGEPRFTIPLQSAP